MLRIMHYVCSQALPAALLLIGMSVMGITDAAAQGSPEARQACTPDAMRLCSEFTSDVSQTTKCMMAASTGEVRSAGRRWHTGRPTARIGITIGTTDIARTATAVDFLIYLPKRKYAQAPRLALRSGGAFYSFPCRAGRAPAENLTRSWKTHSGRGSKLWHRLLSKGGSADRAQVAD